MGLYLANLTNRLSDYTTHARSLLPDPAHCAPTRETMLKVAETGWRIGQLGLAIAVGRQLALEMQKTSDALPPGSLPPPDDVSESEWNIFVNHTWVCCMLAVDVATHLTTAMVSRNSPKWMVTASYVCNAARLSWTIAEESPYVFSKRGYCPPLYLSIGTMLTDQVLHATALAHSYKLLEQKKIEEYETIHAKVKKQE